LRTEVIGHFVAGGFVFAENFVAESFPRIECNGEVIGFRLESTEPISETVVIDAIKEFIRGIGEALRPIVESGG
jgi:hypothetical protein